MGLGFTEVDKSFNPLISWKDFGLSYILKEGFPFPWNEFLKDQDLKSKKVIFSYWELAKDFFEKNQRIALLKKIISLLPYEAYVLLWPLCSFVNNRFVPSEEFFFKGVFFNAGQT